MDQLQIMIVAGEASGDRHAASLARELSIRLADRGCRFFGAAGPRMRDEGVEPVVAADELSIVGLPEIAMALPRFLGAYRKLVRAAEARRPAVAILVDFPDFNLKLARSLKKLGIKVVYYISPQLWAWRRYRIRSIQRYVDLLITILPFEKPWFQSHGVSHVEYVGHPSAGEVSADLTKPAFRMKHGFDAGPLVSLLPGSRQKEVSKIFPVMLSAAKLLIARDPATQFVAAASSERNKQTLRTLAAEERMEERVKIVLHETYDALNASDASAITSGTATLEAAIIGTPMVIVYKTSQLNYSLLEPLISVEHYGLVNLIAGKRLATELIQSELTAERMADEIRELLRPAKNKQFRFELDTVREKLGSGGAAKAAARLVIDMLDTRPQSSESSRS